MANFDWNTIPVKCTCTRENFKPCSITCEAYLGYGSSVKRLIGNFQLQIDVEISEISGNNLWKFPKFPNVRALYMGDFRFSAKSRDFRWYSRFF